MNKITTIIFDFGNVVVFFDHMKACNNFVKFSSYSAEEIYEKIFKSGLEQNFDEGKIVFKNFSISEKEIQLNDEINFEKFSQIWADIFWENVKMTKLIQKLHSLGYTLFLLSNTNILHSSGWITDFPILRLFGGLRYSWNTKEFRKPDLRMWTQAGWDLANSVYVDDNSEYCMASEKAGVKKAFCYNTKKHEEFERELLKFLNRR